MAGLFCKYPATIKVTKTHIHTHKPARNCSASPILSLPPPDCFRVASYMFVTSPAIYENATAGVGVGWEEKRRKRVDKLHLSRRQPGDPK